MRFLGLDPGLRATGWGVITAEGNALHHIASGVIRTDPDAPLSDRLAALHDGLAAVVETHAPDAAAVEESFVARNAASALRLGHARGVALLVPALNGLPVAEYAPNLIKKSLVGTGHAAKAQVGAMVRMLLPGARPASKDAADALAVAICHAHHAATRARLGAAARPEVRA